MARAPNHLGLLDLARLPAAADGGKVADTHDGGFLAERTICVHLDLSAWDRSVALALQQYLEARPEKAAEAKAGQAEYTRARDACGDDVECIRQAEDARVDELVQLRRLP